MAVDMNSNCTGDRYITNKHVISNTRVPFKLLVLQGYGFVTMALTLNQETQFSTSTNTKQTTEFTRHRRAGAWQSRTLGTMTVPSAWKACSLEEGKTNIYKHHSYESALKRKDLWHSRSDVCKPGFSLQQEPGFQALREVLRERHSKSPAPCLPLALVTAHTHSVSIPRHKKVRSQATKRQTWFLTLFTWQYHYASIVWWSTLMSVVGAERNI